VASGSCSLWCDGLGAWWCGCHGTRGETTRHSVRGHRCQPSHQTTRTGPALVRLRERLDRHRPQPAKRPSRCGSATNRRLARGDQSRRLHQREIRMVASWGSTQDHRSSSRRCCASIDGRHPQGLQPWRMASDRPDVPDNRLLAGDGSSRGREAFVHRARDKESARSVDRAPLRDRPTHPSPPHRRPLTAGNRPRSSDAAATNAGRRATNRP